MEQIKLSTLEWIETKNIEPNETDWVLGAWKQEDGWIYRSCMREIEHDGMEHYHTPAFMKDPLKRMIIVATPDFWCHMTDTPDLS